MDWNWYFSSLAQSIAAVVGIHAAFSISSLVSNQADYKRQMGEVRERVARSRALTDALSSRYFSWYNERVLERTLDSIADALRAGEFVDMDPNELLRHFPSSPFLSRETLLSAVSARVEEVRSIGRATPRVPTATPDHALLQSQLQTEREAIDTLVVEVKHNARLVAQLLQVLRTNPEDSPIVRVTIVACLFLFLVAVIYPLSFLPASTLHPPTISMSAFLPTLFSLRGALLFIPGVTFALLCGIVLRTSRGLRYPPALIAELLPLADVSSYSPYLAIFLENDRRGPAEPSHNPY